MKTNTPIPCDANALQQKAPYSKPKIVLLPIAQLTMGKQRYHKFEINTGGGPKGPS